MLPSVLLWRVWHHWVLLKALLPALQSTEFHLLTATYSGPFLEDVLPARHGQGLSDLMAQVPCLTLLTALINTSICLLLKEAEVWRGLFKGWPEA